MWNSLLQWILSLFKPKPQPMPPNPPPTPPSSPTMPSQACYDLIEKFEGFSATPYFDVNGYAIGYGSHYINGNLVTATTPSITQSEAQEYMEMVANDLADQILGIVTITLTRSQLDAIVDLTYNIGFENFKSSTLLACINEGVPIIEIYFTEWDKVTDPQTGQLIVSDNLLKRRVAEYNLFIS